MLSHNLMCGEEDNEEGFVEICIGNAKNVQNAHLIITTSINPEWQTIVIESVKE